MQVAPGVGQCCGNFYCVKAGRNLCVIIRGVGKKFVGLALPLKYHFAQFVPQGELGAKVLTPNSQCNIPLITKVEIIIPIKMIGA